MTSGKAMRIGSSLAATASAVSRLDEGARVTRMLMVPSSSSGTNSVPSLGTSQSAPASRASAISTTSQRTRSAPRNSRR